ncbi:MAG: hypothetical protein V7K97_22740 [Nostoc sp.]|uniref:beta strand repeat-containing protein n=1 Tax=Nostoc sp. TaxID=1180 RepID=UPI002FF549B0
MSTFTVTNTNNSGAGSLRQAVLDANALTGKDIINFSGLFTDGLAHTISLNGSGLSITDNLTIEGTNPSLLTIKDNSADRVFDIGKGVTSAINGLTITNSYKGKAGGGAISNEGILTLSNSIITGNTANNNVTLYVQLIGGGGGIYNTGSLTLNNSIITGNIANSIVTDADGKIIEYEGGGIGGGIYNTGSLTVNYSNITENSAVQGGGIDNSGSLTVNHSTISDNDNSNSNIPIGGGIYNIDIATLNYSTINGNTADEGGGIYSYYGIITVSNSIISGNKSVTDGGGISIDNSTLSVSKSSISDNLVSNGGGGGISSQYLEYVRGSSTIRVSNSTITGNFAGVGGGIFTGENTSQENLVSLSVSNSAITGNKAVGYGGGICAGGSSEIATLNNSLISGNTAGTDGGGIYNLFVQGFVGQQFFGFYGRLNSIGDTAGNTFAETINVNNSLISGNKSGADGGGIYNFGTIALSYSSISGNTALQGAGIYNDGIYSPSLDSFPGLEGYGSVTVSNGTISDNNASTGGGIYNYGNLSVSKSTISHNYASDEGGGIYNSSFDAGNNTNGDNLGIVTVSHSTISGNRAGIAGGGIYNDKDVDFGLLVYTNRGVLVDTQNLVGIVTVTYSTISNNQSHFGGGIYNDGNLTVGNSTITHNKAFGIELSSGREESGDGGGIYNSNSSYATATVDYSTIACNFDTPQEDSTKVIKSDDLVGKFISKHHDNWICNLSGSTFSYS